MHDVCGSLDLDRYPPDRPHLCGALIGACRASLDSEGLFNLPGLVRAEAVARAAGELVPLVRNVSFHHVRTRNIYFVNRIEGVPEDHPAYAQSVASNHTVCGDQIEDSLVSRLYEWKPLADFLARVMDKPHLHLMDDPLVRINVMGYRDGETLSWHFDRSEFTTTLVIQTPVAGGDFEYRTELRSDDDPNLNSVAHLLQGQGRDVRSLRLEAGTLSVFSRAGTPPIASRRSRAPWNALSRSFPTMSARTSCSAAKNASEFTDGTPEAR